MKGNKNLKYNYVVYLSVLFTKNRPKLMELINQLPTDVRDNTKHYIQELIDDGKEETKREAVQNMLFKNADIDFICDVMNVSKEFVHNVRKDMSPK